MFSCSCVFILHFLTCSKSLHTYIQVLSYVEQFVLLYLSIAVQVQEYCTNLQQKRLCPSLTQVCPGFVFCSLSYGFICPIRTPSQIFKFPGGLILLCHPQPVIKYPLCFSSLQFWEQCRHVFDADSALRAMFHLSFAYGLTKNMIDRKSQCLMNNPSLTAHCPWTCCDFVGDIGFCPTYLPVLGGSEERQHACCGGGFEKRSILDMGGDWVGRQATSLIVFLKILSYLFLHYPFSFVELLVFSFLVSIIQYYSTPRQRCLIQCS